MWSLNTFSVLATSAITAPRSAKFISVSILLVTLFTSFSGYTYSEYNKPQLRVAVAANFKHSLETLLPEFQRKYKVEVSLSSAATGTLFQQIRHGAPFDIFLSADSLRPQLLEEQNLIIEGSRAIYTRGELALYAPNQKAKPTLSQLAQHQGRLAIANPKIAPYGKASREVLENLKLWPYPKHQLIVGTNINQTFQQLYTKTIPLGFIAFSQAKQLGVEQFVYLLPQNLYSPLNQQLVILKSSKNKALAQKLSDYLTSQPVQSKLETLGYADIGQGEKK